MINVYLRWNSFNIYIYFQILGTVFMYNGTKLYDYKKMYFVKWASVLPSTLCSGRNSWGICTITLMDSMVWDTVCLGKGAQFDVAKGAQFDMEMRHSLTWEKRHSLTWKKGTVWRGNEAHLRVGGKEKSLPSRQTYAPDNFPHRCMQDLYHNWLGEPKQLPVCIHVQNNHKPFTGYKSDMDNGEGEG